MIPGLLLALVSAAAINIGFLLQHRGLRAGRGAGGVARLRFVLRDRSWLSGQALGWIGFAAQVAAVAIAPLSLVQSFAAGGLVLSVPLAAGIFRHAITRTQIVAVLVMAAGLASLPLGFSTAADRLGTEALILGVTFCALAGLVLVLVGAPWSRATAAGIFYGGADAAIKAISLGWRHDGAAALISGWTAVAAGGTFAGFLAFQSALGDDGAVSAISLMNALAALVALGCGLGAFGESLGPSPALTVGHGLAIGLVLAGVPVLAAAQTAIVEPGEEREQRAPTRAAAVPVADSSR